VPVNKIHTVRYALSPSELVAQPLSTDIHMTEDAIHRAFVGHDGLIFVGNGANPTNVVALDWFFTQIYSSILEYFGDVYLTIIGADWQSIAEKHPHFRRLVDIRGLQSQVRLMTLEKRVFVYVVVES